MAGIVAKMIMHSMMKSKPKNLHYVPRDYPAEREKAKKLSAMQPLPKDIHCTKEAMGYWFEKEGADRCKAVMLIHGGGFNTGSAEYAYNSVRHLCISKDFSVFAVEYRLAPEHPYPAGLEDCVNAYRHLLSLGMHGKDIVFVGDSAGGNLVFATALYLRDHGIELPAGLCGISPVGEVDGSLPSRKDRVDRDPIIGADFTEEMAVTYVKDHDPKEPYLSPIYGDFTGFPPVWICVGTEEVFYDDAFALRSAMQRANVPVELLVGEGLCHVYPMFPDPQSTKANKSMLTYINACLQKKNES